MAKKEQVNFDELNLDEIDFGADFDFNTEGEIKFDADDSRSPIESFTTSVKDGLKDRIMDRGLIRRLMSFALPKGYSQAFNAYDSLSNGVADIYKDNAAEMQPYMAKTSRFLKQQNPMFKRLLPKSAREALEASENESESWNSGQDDKLNSDINGIDKLLGMEARNKLDDNIADARRDVRARKEFNTTTGISIEMGKAIGRLVQYQDTVLINYHRKSLELKYRHLDVSMRTFHSSEVFQSDALDLLKAVGKNTALPDFVKMRNTEIIKEQLRHRLANNVIGSASNFARKHLGSIKDNISQSLGGALGTINAAGAMGGGMSRSAMAGQAAGGLVSEGLADLLEFAVKEGLTKLGLGKEAGYVKSGGRWLQDKLSGTSQRLNDYARSETTATGLRGQFEDFVKRQLDSYTITDKINGGGVYALDESAKFDNLFHKTVVEIIPGQLSSMEKWLRTIATGQEQEEHAYSHYSGGFVTRDVLNKQHIDVGLKAGGGDAVRKQLDYLLKDMDAEGLSTKAKRALRARLMTDMSSNRDFNPKTYVKPDTWTNAGPETAEELVEFFAEKYGINIDGEYDDEDEDAKERRTKARGEYLDLAPRIADYTGRMAGLSEVIGRRSWRELGLAKYDGRTGDTIDTNAVYSMIANEGGDEFVDDRKKEEKAEDFTWSKQGIKDGINARADLARKKLAEKEAEQKRLAEEAAKAAENIKVDVDAGKTAPGAGGTPTPGPAPVIQGQFGLDPLSIEKLTSSLSEVLAQSQGGQYEMTLPENLETVDSGTHDRLDNLSELLGTSYQQQFDMLDAILNAIKDNDPCACEGRSPDAPYEDGDSEEVEGSNARDGLSRWGRAKGAAWRGIKRAPGMAIRGLGRYLGWSYRKIGQGISGGFSLGKMVAGAPFKSIKGLGVTDVHIQGDPDPVMTARDIRRGFFFDVKTKKVIEKIKDITGPVKNRDGELVLTQEDFDKGLMSGDGESLAGWGLRKSLGMGLGLAGLAGRYVKTSYGLMGKALKGVFNLAYDQFVQFDAYFPGDEEPRIRSNLLKKGFYRDKDGAPLKSLKDITGPVYDIEDNEVISQEELDKYKSLYTRNGSLLFTVGRGLVSGTAWAGGLAKRAAIGYAKMAGKFYKGLWKGAKALGRGIKSMGMGLAGKFGFKSGTPAAQAAGGMHGDEELHTAMFEVGIAQLDMQRNIFELLREKFKMDKRDKWDLDGDGDRDNSWNDILKRRKSNKDDKDAKKGSRGGSEDIVKAIDALGKNLEESIDVLGDRVEESTEDGLLDQAADIGNITEGWGDGGGEGRGRRRGRGGRGGRGLRGRMRGIGGRIAGSRAAGWAVRGGTMAVEGAMGVGSAIMGSSMMAGLGTAAMAAGTTAMGWLGAGATAIASVLSAPVVLAVAAVAAIGYVGYRWYKSSQAKDNPIFYLRMTQYGVAPTDETRVKQMLALEELLLPAVTFVGDKANIDASKVSIPELMKILEIEEGEDTRLKWALKWLSQRFRPVFLAHVGGMKKTVKSTKLSEADQLIDGSVIKEFLEIVDLKNFEKIYNAILESPFDSTMGFGGSLDCGASDVEDAFALVRDRIKETEKKPEPVKSQEKPVDPDAEGGELGKAVAAVGVGAMGVVANAAKKGPEGEPLDIGGMIRSGIDPTTALPPTAAGVGGAAAAVAMTALPLPPGGPVSKEVDGATVSTTPTAAPATPPDDPALAARWMNEPLKAADPVGIVGGAVGSLLKNYYQVQASKVKTFAASLDIPTAVRYLEYGLVNFDEEKCKQLQQVEELYWDFLKFNGYDNALIDGDLTGLEDTVISIFTPTGGNPQNVLMWLRYRFMPTFLQYAISVRRRLPGDVRQAPRNLTSSLMRDVLLETTQAVDSDSGQLVWLNMPSPWPNYVLGKDAGAATPYIDALPQSLKTLAVDGLKNMIGKAAGSKAEEADPAIEGSNLNQGSPNQQKEEGGIFSNAVSSVKKFFGFGSDPGGTSGGSSSGMSASGGGPGYTPIPGVGGPPVSSVGAQVTHPGGGTGGDINSLPTASGDGWEAMKGIIMGAAKMSGFDPFISANVAAVESRFKPRAGAGTSSAKGLYQFVNGTWGDMLRKYGRKYGIAANTHQFDPRANALMGMEYLKENYAYLKEKAKVPVTDTALYAAHFLGAYGARKFLTAPGSANSEDIVGSAAVKANASVFREPTGRKGVYGRVRTVAEALAEIDRRMQEARGQHDLKPGQQPVVAEGSENKAAENRPQTGEGETGGAEPEIGMDTAAAQGGGGAPTADAPAEGSTGGGYGPSAQAGGSGGGAVTNASNGSPTASGGGGQSYDTPPSPDGAAAAASGNAVLTREPDDDQGTFGQLRLPDGTEYCTLELPWRGNATGASCIPPGTYQVAMRNSPKFGQIYEVQNVPGRTAILIHSGNVAGDEAKGYNSHVEGCILLGLSKGKVGGQKAVQQSRAAITQFNEKMGGRPFTMTVVGAGANTSAKSAGEAPEEEGQSNATGVQDPAAAANGAASGSSAAVNTQQAPTGGDPSSGSALGPTMSQSTAAMNQNTTAASTAELSNTVGPLLQKQLEVQQSMDGSLKEIRDYLKAMAGQQPVQQQGPGETQPQPGSKDGQRQWAPEDEPVATQPRGTSTSSGSGRNPINTRRNNAVT